MAKDEIDDLEKKKQELEEQLHQIHDELDESFDKVRSDVSSTLNPKKIILRYPLPAMGASILLGFLIGHKGKGNSTSTDNSTTSTSTTREFGSALLSELKRLATRKAITFATDYVEGIIEEKAEKHLSDNGEKED